MRAEQGLQLVHPASGAPKRVQFDTPWTKPPPKSFLQLYLRGWKKFAVSDGRASRREYWSFVLGNCCLFFCLGLFCGLTGQSKEFTALLSTVMRLFVLVPSFAVGIRRMHDMGRSGWFLLVPIYSLILVLSKGQEGANAYGPDPLGGSRSTVGSARPKAA
jgi:uncharacterized membrane protein YhaH (DUF805 family)